MNQILNSVTSRAAIATAVAVLLQAPTFAADMKDALAPTGVLRATFLGNNPVQGRVNPKTGVISGPAADIVKELAARLAVPYKITPGENVRAVLDSVKGHTADIGFLAFDATRATEVDFTQPYSLGFNTYLVKNESLIKTVADADRKGIRIAAQKGDSGELYLGRTLKNAELRGIPAPTREDVQKMLISGQIDAFATNRQRLFEWVALSPGLRLASDNFFGVEQSIVIAQGDKARLDYLNRMINELRDSEFFQASIDRAKLNGVEVAPARKP